MSKVLNTMKKMATEPVTAFPLKSQYVKSVTEARAVAGKEPEIDEDDAGEPCAEPVAKATRNKPKKSQLKRKKAAVNVDEKEWNYNQVRMDFIKKIREEDADLSFAEAKTVWDESSAKKEFLKGISVQELKRRKFIPKGSTENPWSK